MQESLLRFKTDQKYLVFDFETCNTNLVDTDNKPWQLGYAICQGKDILSLDIKYINWPELKISEEAARITKFNPKIYRKLAEDAVKVLNDFETYLYDPTYRIIGHNILGFDVYIHNLYRKLLGKTPDYLYIDRCIDTHVLAKAIKLGIKYDIKENIMAFQYRMLSTIAKGLKTRLEILGKEYNIDFDPETLHDAGNDVKLNWFVWHKIMYQIEI